MGYCWPRTLHVHDTGLLQRRIWLCSNDDLPSHNVTEKDLDTFCKEHNFTAWANTSVKNNWLIKESMSYLLREMMNKYKEVNKENSQKTELTSSELYFCQLIVLKKKVPWLPSMLKGCLVWPIVYLDNERPYNMDPHVVEYYPPIREINSLMLRLRAHGLFRDEHLDFKEEMKRLRILRGKVKPKKGEGKRAMKKK
ncbi:MRPS33 [Acanthosepion pharaonis]|uniref:Small ribosomal subunit protein mS33 n=1 Tax=Acanthosepion pharaonis TaxID=158019 RepID=A0A812D2P3_ACAPH|nr:MRPS33 [Sepia pharaonis]